MKKNLIAVAVLTTSVLSTAAIYADDGQVQFNGEILDTACEVVNTVANPQVVTLGQVSKKAFTGVGSTAAPTNFNLQLKKCPATAKTATVKFDGIAKGGDSKVLDLTQESGVATGVGIQLSDKSGAVLPLYTASVSYDLQADPAINNLPFVARYVSTDATVKAGKANAVSNFTIIYN